MLKFCLVIILEVDKIIQKHYCKQKNFLIQDSRICFGVCLLSCANIGHIVTKLMLKKGSKLANSQTLQAVL